MQLKSALLIMSLSLLSCATVPDRPLLWQFTLKNKDVAKPGFYYVDPISNDRIFRPFTDPEMDSAQCLSIEDQKRKDNYDRQMRKAATCSAK